jgi:hypothetical protein
VSFPSRHKLPKNFGFGLADSAELTGKKIPVNVDSSYKGATLVARLDGEQGFEVAASRPFFFLPKKKGCP